jgi:starvation-inducible DNA-binding protein
MKTSSSTSKKHANVVADELTHLLADTYTLYLKTQNFHWNVTGPLFPQLHALFETQYTELAAAIDTIAERIRTLGAHTPASFSEFQKLSSLKEATSSKIAANEMLKQLHKDHDIICEHLLSIFDHADQLDDQGTVDMVTGLLRAHEKTVWILKSSME